MLHHDERSLFCRGGTGRGASLSDRPPGLSPIKSFAGTNPFFRSEWTRRSKPEERCPCSAPILQSQIRRSLHATAQPAAVQNVTVPSEGSKGQIRKEGCSSELNDPARPTADRTVSTPSDSAGKAQNIQVITKLLYYILLDIYIYIYI